MYNKFLSIQFVFNFLFFLIITFIFIYGMEYLNAIYENNEVY